MSLFLLRPLNVLQLSDTILCTVKLYIVVFIIDGVGRPL